MVEAVFTEEEKKSIKAVVEEFPKLRLAVESLRETLEILSDKELMNDIEQGKKDIAEGRVYTHKQMLEEIGVLMKKKFDFIYPSVFINSSTI